MKKYVLLWCVWAFCQASHAALFISPAEWISKIDKAMQVGKHSSSQAIEKISQEYKVSREVVQTTLRKKMLDGQVKGEYAQNVLIKLFSEDPKLVNAGQNPDEIVVFWLSIYQQNKFEEAVLQNVWKAIKPYLDQISVAMSAGIFQYVTEHPAENHFLKLVAQYAEEGLFGTILIRLIGQIPVPCVPADVIDAMLIDGEPLLFFAVRHQKDGLLKTALEYGASLKVISSKENNQTFLQWWLARANKSPYAEAAVQHRMQHEELYKIVIISDARTPKIYPPFAPSAPVLSDEVSEQ